MRKILTNLFFLFLLFSCNQPTETKIKSEKAETFEERDDRRMSEAIDDITLKLNLPNLKKGVEDFEIRVWCPVSTIVENIITFRKIDSILYASETSVWLTYPEYVFTRKDTSNTLLKVIVDSSKSKRIVLKSKEVEVIETFPRNFIDNFPSNANFDSTYEASMDGGFVYIFEVAIKDKHKWLIYRCNRAFADNKFREIVVKFFNFLHDHINAKVPYCE